MIGAALPIALLLLAACDGSGTDSELPTQAELLAEYTLSGEDSYPESVAWDPESRSFYTSSLGRGDVTGCRPTEAARSSTPGTWIIPG
jgi:hypothetical protein